MVYRAPEAAPASRIPPEQRGRVVGRYCLACHQVFPEHRRCHDGKPIHGRDHVPSPCAHEGEPFGDAAEWWDLAVETLRAPVQPAAPAPPPGAAAGPAPAPVKG